MGLAGLQRQLLVLLAVAALALVGLAVASLVLLIAAGGADWTVVLPVGLALLGLLFLWQVWSVARDHAVALERLKGAMVSLAGDRSARLPQLGDEAAPDIQGLHAALAARKIPAQLRERRRFAHLAKELRDSEQRWTSIGEDAVLKPHVESWLWIWQVRTGMVMLVLGSFHLVLIGIDIFTPLFGERPGIEAATSMARTAGGLVWVYGVLLLCVEFHAGIGLYRLAIKWGAGARLGRTRARGISRKGRASSVAPATRRPWTSTSKGTSWKDSPSTSTVRWKYPPRVCSMTRAPHSGVRHRA